MNVNSMTGFGRAEQKDDQFLIVVEIKSVNHRFMDLKIKQPSFLSHLEINYRNLSKEKFKRGSFDLSIMINNIKINTKADEIDWEKVKTFINSFEQNLRFEKTSETSDCSSFNPQVNFLASDFMKSEFLIDKNNGDHSILDKIVLKAVDNAMEKLMLARLEEGNKLKIILQTHIDSYIEYFKVIEQNTDHFEESVRERILNKFSQYDQSIEIEKPRFMQEVIYYLEKIDIHEEINRIHSHLEKIKNIIEKKEPIGRELEFTLQELNRETNTIGSKSSLPVISDNVVKMKVQLEKIREQSLNIE